MGDDREGKRARRVERAQDSYDRRVRQAICSAQWTARWSAYAASIAPDARTGGIATAKVRVVDPTSRLLSSLARLGYLIGGHDNWYLAKFWPRIDSPFVLERSSKTTIRVLSTALKGEAEFEVLVIPSRE